MSTTSITSTSTDDSDTTSWRLTMLRNQRDNQASVLSALPETDSVLSTSLLQDIYESKALTSQILSAYTEESDDSEETDETESTDDSDETDETETTTSDSDDDSDDSTTLGTLIDELA
ncbi:MAG TPA: hypothetical protein VLM37_07995 [Fibrobacteraceae bacterium]|nr:hypothetical protein [Fibrobacteraceae bacterium]